MLIVFLLFVAIFSAFAALRTRRDHPAFKMLISILFVWLVAETLAYGYLLYTIFVKKEYNFYLIGNQFVLDKLLYKQVYDQYLGARGGQFGPSEETGYGLAKDLFEGDLRQTTSDGFRGTHNYALEPSEDKLRVIAIGDSYVYCDGEKVQNCWTTQLESSVGGLEVLNFGVSGFGLGQSYARFIKSALKYNPDVVYLNYISTTVRDGIVPGIFLQGVSLNKSPYYRLEFSLNEDGFEYYPFSALSLFDPKIRDKVVYKRMGIDPKKEFWFNPVFSISNIGIIAKEKFAPVYYLNNYQPKEDRRLELNIRIFKELFKLARENDFSIVLFVREKFNALPKEIQTLLNSNQDKVFYVSWPDIYYPIVISAWQKQGTFPIVNDTEHFNAAGNLFYAKLVGSFLESKEWSHKERTFEYNERINSFVGK